MGFLASIIAEKCFTEASRTILPFQGKSAKHVAVLDKVLRVVTKLRERSHSLRFKKQESTSLHFQKITARAVAHPQGFDSVGEHVGQGLRASSGLERSNAIKAMGKTDVCNSHARHLSKPKVRLLL